MDVKLEVTLYMTLAVLHSLRVDLKVCVGVSLVELPAAHSRVEDICLSSTMAVL